MKIFYVIIGLVLSNFLYQEVHNKNWSIALERSWFQFVAVVITAFVLSLK